MPSSLARAALHLPQGVLRFKDPMRARLHDPYGPHLPRLVLPILGFACMALALYWRMVDGPPVSPCFFVGLALLVAGPLLAPRHLPREVSAVAGAGCIAIRNAGVLRQTLRARDIVAAYSSTSDGTVTFALARRGRASAPILLQLSEADSPKAREALRIGSRGFGSLSWAVQPRQAHTWIAFIRAFGAVVALHIAALTATDSFESNFAGFLGALLVPALPALALVFAMYARATRARGCLVLTEHAVHMHVEDQGYRVPYASIERVEDTPDGIRIVRVSPNRPVFVCVHAVRYARRGMTSVERAAAIAQIRAEALRAREGSENAAPRAAGALARQHQEGSHAWLVRLEAAAQLVSAGASANYRGSGIAEGDLWAALENEDAAADLRAAAARVLSRAPHAYAKRRVDAILGGMRDHAARERIRVVIDPDLEAASRALEELTPASKGAATRT